MGDNPDPSRVSVEPAEAQPAPQVMLTAWARSPGFSFCIITHGRRPEKLRREIASIRALQIPHYEILVGGDVAFELPEGVVFVPAVAAARAGRLGEMRNRLVERARYDHLIVADDDLLLHPDFYQGLLAFGEDYEVMCVRILNPDGTRFWDWAATGGPQGQVLLDYGVVDPFLYVTGGLCVLKAQIADAVKWDGRLGFYQNEDVEFSRRLQARGFSFSFNGDCTVMHDDCRYTQIGNSVFLVDELPHAPHPGLNRCGWQPYLEIADRYYREGWRYRAAFLLATVARQFEDDAQALLAFGEIACQWRDFSKAAGFLKRAQTRPQDSAHRLQIRQRLEDLEKRSGPPEESAGTRPLVAGNASAPNVLFEVSRLCQPNSFGLLRHSSTRAAENLVWALLASRQCQLKLCCLEDNDRLNLLRSYLAQQRCLPGVELLTSQPDRWLTELQFKYKLQAEQRGRKTFLDRLIMEVLRLWIRSPSPFKPGGVRRSHGLCWAHILHLPFFGVDPSLPEPSGGVRFQTIEHAVPGLLSLAPDVEQAGSLMRQALRHPPPSHWFFCGSLAAKNELCSLIPQLDPERLAVLYPAVSERFCPCTDAEMRATTLKKFGLDHRPYFITNAPTTPAPPASDPALRCFHRLTQQEKLSESSLVIIGPKDGSQEQLLARGSNHRCSTVIVTGPVTDQELAVLYGGASAGLFFSLYEGCSLAILEAMKCGAPLIAFRVSSFPELAGEACLLLDPGDEDSACQGMLALWRNTDAQVALQKQALARASQFQAEHSAQQALAAYRKALAWPA